MITSVKKRPDGTVTASMRPSPRETALSDEVRPIVLAACRRLGLGVDELIALAVGRLHIPVSLGPDQGDEYGQGVLGRPEQHAAFVRAMDGGE